MKTAQDHAYQTLVLLDVIAARKEVASTRVAEGKATVVRIIRMLHAWCERNNTEDSDPWNRRTRTGGRERITS